MDPRLDRLFSTLDAEFDAAIDREENEAASDLAFSLLQDRTLLEVLVDGAWEATTSMGAVSIEEVGLDYAGGMGWIFPSDQYPFKRAAGVPPIPSEHSMVERLRGHARNRRAVEVITPTGVARGRLGGCGRDYLQLHSEAGETLIPMNLVGAVRLFHEG